jgi:chromate transporter
MRGEFVERHRQFDDDEFVEMIALTNLIPGPNSTELALHIGQRERGGRGMVVAGVAFILPAVIVVSILAALYERHGAWSALPDLRAGILPAMVAIVADAVWGLRRTAASTASGASIALVAAAAALLGVDEFVVLVVALVGGAAGAMRQPSALAAIVVHPSLLELLWRFLVIGSVVYGSGYVLLAYLHEAFVENGWLTAEQLLDAITVGQVTPGPVFTTATFLGWQFAGVAGAAVATVGIFGPSFLFVAALSPIRRWVARHDTARAALRTVTAASLGLMTAVAVQLARTALTDPVAIVSSAVALTVLLRWRPDPTWIVGVGVLVGIVRALV